jgi:hypothetical protein
MSKKIGGVVALAGLCALSLFLLNCGSSSSRPSGLLYVLTQGTNAQGIPSIGYNVSSFSIDFDNGTLSLINSNASTCQTAATNANPEPCGLPLDILLDPTGGSAFVLNQGIPCVNDVCGSNNPVSASISAYTVNSDGSLSNPGTPVIWTCVSPSATSCTQANAYTDTAVAMARDAAGQFLFVINRGVFPLPTTCPSIASAVTNAEQATDFLGCPSISVFTMQSGSVTFVSQSTTYQSPLFLSKLPSGLSAIAFTPPGGAAQELLFVTDNYDLCTVGCVPAHQPNDNAVSVYAVSSSGILTEQQNSPYAVAAISPISVIAVNTNPPTENTGGLFVYVGNQDPNGGHLYPFQVCTVVNAVCTSADVAISLMTPLASCPQPSCDIAPTSVGQSPVGMLVDPTNSFLYVVSEGSNQVFGFNIATTAGTLTALSGSPQPSQGSQPGSMALHPSVNNTGQYLYVSNSNSQSVAGFTLSTTTGSMSNVTTVITPSAPSGMAAH